MKKAGMMIIALGLALNGWCQDVQEIMNIRTPNHVQFEDFDYAIIPPNTAYQKSPSGFVSSFVNDSDDIEIELTQTPTSTSGDSLAEKAKAAAAVWKEYRIDGHKAFLFKEQPSQQGEGALTLLYFGENFPLTIRATYPASIENKVYDGLVKAELSLIYVGPTQQSDGRFENSVFSIVNGGFKAQKIGQLLTTFSHSGDSYAEMNQGKKVYFQVMVEDLAVKNSQRKKTASALLKGTMDDDMVITQKNSTTIGGMKGFEYYLEQKDSTGTITAKGYAAIVFSDQKMYFFTSCANEDIDKNIQKFREIAQSFKLK